jgi:hypothetical protein
MLLALLGSGMLSVGCVSSQVVPDQSIPHQLAADTCGVILVKHPNGQVERQKVRIPAGYWIASPQTVEGR